MIKKQKGLWPLLVVLGFMLMAAGCAGVVVAGLPQPRIPPGHLPPPGKCRIWYPDRPPGQQPPPGDCHILELRVPPGAYLIRG